MDITYTVTDEQVSKCYDNLIESTCAGSVKTYYTPITKDKIDELKNTDFKQKNAIKIGELRCVKNPKDTYFHSKSYCVNKQNQLVLVVATVLYGSHNNYWNVVGYDITKEILALISD